MKNFTKYLMFMCLCSLVTSLQARDILTLDKNTTTITQEIPSDPCYGATVVEFNQGLASNGNAVLANRSIAERALDEPDRVNASNGFVSLGINGSIVIEFSGYIYDAPGVDILIFETSFSGDVCNGSQSEKALIELSDGTNWVAYPTEICRDGEIDIAGLGLEYVTQIRITDVTTSGGDGYDVDGVVAVNGCEDGPRVCSVSNVVVNSYVPGPKRNDSPITDPRRLDPSKALGTPEEDNTFNFVSLGYGGTITFSFSGVVMNNPGDDVRIVETTFGNSTFANYPESADVYVSQTGVDFYLIGSVVTNGSNSLDIDNAPLPLSYIKYVKLVDTTPEGSVSEDGFDIDGIVAIQGCSDEPIAALAACSATEVVEYILGTKKNESPVAAVRTNPNNALGTPEGTDQNVFTTLGYGGSLTLAFDGAILNGDGPDLVFIETSFNQPFGCEAYREYADIYVSFDNFTYNYAGTVCKSNNAIDISDAGAYQYINYVKIVNNNELSTTPDGYDLDGVLAIYNCENFDVSALLTDGSLLLSTDDFNSREIEFSTFPNPTTGISNIKFNAPDSGNMTIEAYDLLGRRVATVFNKEVFESQSYTVTFDGSNLPNGMYLFRITLGGSTSVEKFVISH